MSMRTLLYYALGLLAVAVAWMLAGCATLAPSQAQSCEQYAVVRTAELARAGYQIVDAGIGMDRDGVIVYAKFINSQTRGAVIDAMIDTDAIRNKVTAAGFQDAGSCFRGERPWYIMRKSVQLPPQEKKLDEASGAASGASE